MPSEDFFDRLAQALLPPEHEVYGYFANEDNRLEIIDAINNCKDMLQSYIDNGNTDIESSHRGADNALLNLLDDIGLGDISTMFEQVAKWYA